MGTQAMTQQAIAPIEMTDSSSYSVGLGSVTQEVIEIKTGAPEILIYTDKDGKVILTVYKDGHIEGNAKQIDKMTAYFWQQFAKAYRKELECSK
jgi:hypothetical protein